MSKINKISVIMAEHNTNLNELDKCLKSLENQTYDNYEIIIVDDNTSKINKEYLSTLKDKNNKVKIITNETNLGLAASLNKGICNSRGEYIFRMDTDDIALPNRFERQIQILNNGYDITTARAIVIDKNDKEIGKTKKIPFYNTTKRIALYYFFSNGVIHPLIAAKREVFDEFKYDEKVKFGQDFELWLRMASKYHIYFDSEILLKYRRQNKFDEEKLFYQYYNHYRVAKKYSNDSLIKKIGAYRSDRSYKKIVCNRLDISEKEFDEKLRSLRNEDLR